MAFAREEQGHPAEGATTPAPLPLTPDNLAAASAQLGDHLVQLGAAIQQWLMGAGMPLGAVGVLVLGLILGLAGGAALRRGSYLSIRRLETAKLSERWQRLGIGLLAAVRYRAFSLAVPAGLALALVAIRAQTTFGGTLALTAALLFVIYRLGVAVFPLVAHPFDPSGFAERLEQRPIAHLWRAGRFLFGLTLLGLLLGLAERGFTLEAELRGTLQFLFSLAVLAGLIRLRNREAWLQAAGGPAITPARRFLVAAGRAAIGAAAVFPVLASGLGYHTAGAAFLINLLLTVVLLLTIGTLGFGAAQSLRRLGRIPPPTALAPVVTAQRLDKSSRLGAALVQSLTVAGVLVAGLAVWGFPLGQVWAGVAPLLFGFQVGGYRLSLIALLAGLAVLVGTFYFGHWLRRRMLAHMLPQITSDAGLRNSIASLLYYAIMVVGILLAVAVAGFDLTNLALIAGALSVGIGFGLQNVVNNFVSGLILLFERPIKVGDVLEYGGSWAEVQDIRVRSTVVRTFDRAELIVPNSELVSATVTNWSHSDRKSRVILPVRVAYGTDPQQVRDLIRQAATEHPAVLDDPAPMALFQDFGDSGLAFEARFFVDVNDYVTAPSDVRYRLVELFRAEGIAIPYPQRDVHVSGPGLAGSG